MKEDDIICLALNANLLNYVDLETPRRHFIRADAGVEEVTRFASLVAAAEREACAEICRAYAMPDGTSITAMVLEKAIRARGET